MSHRLASFDDLEEAFYENALLPTVTNWIGLNMSDNYQGTIQKVHNNRGRWSFLMDDDNWYGIGRKEPTHADGSTVADGDITRFEWDSNEKGGRVYRNIVEGSIKVKKGNGPPPRKNSGGGGKSYGGGGATDAKARAKYWEDKELRDIDTQKRISMAGAYNTALTSVQAKFNNELLKVTGKSAAAKLEAFEQIVHDEACRLYAIFMGTAAAHDEIIAQYSGGEQKEEKLEEDLDDAPFEADESAGDDDDWD